MIGILIFACLVGGIVCPPGDHEVPCYHCDAHDSLPHCLEHMHHCHHEEACFMSHNHGEVKIECRKRDECNHIHGHICAYTDSPDVDCETCCLDASCVAHHTGTFQIQVAKAPVQNTALSCYHCDAHKDSFPWCLSTIHQCHHDQACFFSHKHHGGEVKIECRKKEDCNHLHGHICTLDDPLNTDCETCCLDDSCISHHVDAFLGIKEVTKPPTVATTTATTTTTVNVASTCKDHVPDCYNLPSVCNNTLAPYLCQNYCSLCPTTTMTPAVTVTPDPVMTTPPPSAATVQVWERLLQGPCTDLLIQDGCKAGADNYCRDVTGVSLCPETCGLCSVLKTQYITGTTCEDKLLNGVCALTATGDFCQQPLAETTCPATCNLCETVLLKNIHYVIYQLQAITHAPTAAPMTTPALATLPPIIDVTQIIVTYYLGACVDYANDCSTMSNPCGESLTSQLCRKFCNVCQDNDTTQKHLIPEFIN